MAGNGRSPKFNFGVFASAVQAFKALIHMTFVMTVPVGGDGKNNVANIWRYTHAGNEILFVGESKVYHTPMWRTGCNSYLNIPSNDFLCCSQLMVSHFSITFRLVSTKTCMLLNTVSTTWLLIFSIV